MAYLCNLCAYTKLANYRQQFAGSNRKVDSVARTEVLETTVSGMSIFKPLFIVMVSVMELYNAKVTKLSTSFQNSAK